MSTVVIGRESLLEAVRKIIAVCERAGSATLPHFFHIRVDGLGKVLNLSASNMFRRVKLLLDDVGEHQPFCIGIPGEPLLNLLENIHEKEVTFKIDDKLTIEFKKCAYKLPIIFSDSFPRHEEPDAGKWVQADLESMFSAMEQVLYSSDKDSERSFAKSVNFIKEGFFCTNGFRLSFYPCESFDLKSPAMIPREGVEAFIRLFKGNKEPGYLILEQSKVHFSRGHTYASTNLYSGQVPHIWSVVPSGACALATLSKEEILPVLKRMQVFSKAVTKIVPALEMKFSATGVLSLDFKVQNHVNSAEEMVLCRFSGPETVILCNLNYLYDAIKNLKSSVVIIEVRGANYPVIITDEGRVHKNVVVPITNRG